MKDMRHHLGRIQRDVIRAARKEAAEAELREQDSTLNGHEYKTAPSPTTPNLPMQKAA